jgi:hypothetical protein
MAAVLMVLASALGPGQLRAVLEEIQGSPVPRLEGTKENLIRLDREETRGIAFVYNQSTYKIPLSNIVIFTICRGAYSGTCLRRGFADKGYRWKALSMMLFNVCAE